MKTEPNARRPRITGLSHIAFYSSDVEKAVTFYKNMLGMQDVLRLPESGGKLERAFVKINDLQYVELVPEHEAKTDRLVHYGFAVEDAEAVRAFLAGQGVRTPARVAPGRTGNPTVSVKDPDGHLIEFVQHDPKCWPMREAGGLSSKDRVSSRLMHIGFTVYALRKSMDFYRDTLGFSETWRGSRDDKQLSWVQMKLEDSVDYIEYMLYDEPPSLEKLGIMNHFGLEVPSMAGAVAAVQARPAFAEYTRALEPKVGTCRHRLCNLFDPDGSRAELMERPTFDGSVTPSSPALPPR